MKKYAEEGLQKYEEKKNNSKHTLSDSFFTSSWCDWCLLNRWLTWHETKTGSQWENWWTAWWEMDLFSSQFNLLLLLLLLVFYCFFFLFFFKYVTGWLTAQLSSCWLVLAFLFFFLFFWRNIICELRLSCRLFLCFLRAHPCESSRVKICSFNM